MNNVSLLRIGRLAAFLACAFLVDAGHAQAPPSGVFSEIPTAVVPRTSPLLEPATLRSRVVKVDTQKIAAARRGREVLKLNLFDDAAVEVQIKRVRPTQTGYFISGTPRGMDWGEVRLIVNGPVMVGTVETSEGKFTIRWGGAGRHIIRQVDPRAEPFECEAHDSPIPDPSGLPAISSIDRPPSLAQPPAPQTHQMPTEDGSELRILVVHTAAMQSQEGGASGMRALIDLLVQSTNQSFEDSGISPRLVLAHTAIVDYVAVSPTTDLGRLKNPDDGHMDEVHSLRTEYAADLVHLLTNVTPRRVVGAAHILLYEQLVYERDGFAVTADGSERVFTHEIGHNLGVRHDRYAETLSYRTIFPYAYGYVNKEAVETGAEPTARWRTVMAHNSRCGDLDLYCPPLLRFSNPNQRHLGDPLGVSGDSAITGVDGPADASRTINNTARWVGSFRSEACTDFRVGSNPLVAPVNGGEVVLTVDTDPGCIWDASSKAEFVTISSDGRFAGSGVLRMQVTPNDSGAERSGTLTVAGETVTFRQLARDAGICGRTSIVIQRILQARPGPVTCEDITEEDLARVGSLSLVAQGITALEEDDFAGLSGLTRLELQSNQLTDLPDGLLDGLSRLKTLLLQDNLLTEFREGLFADLSSLELVNLNRNQLNTLPAELFAGHSSLERIYLTNNELTQLPSGLFAGLSGLEYLTIGYNDISGVPADLFAGLSSLEYLALHANELTSVPAGLFSGLTNLSFLSLLGNQLTTLPGGIFDDLVNLENLQLAFNRIDALPANTFRNLANLKTLSLSRIQMATLPANLLSGLSRLEELTFWDGQLTTLPAGTFAGLTSLRYLNLHSNELTEFPSGLFSGLTNLQRLNIGGHDMSTLPPGIFSGLSRLEELSLYKSNLTALPAGIFSGLTSLKKLNVFRNQLSGLPDGIFSGLTSLESLILAENTVDPLPISVGLGKAGVNGFKAVVPIGAPFAMDLPVSVSSDGEIDGDISSLAVSTGAVGSDAVGITRKEGTQGKITADIGVLPVLPDGHDGYVLQKDDSVPLTVLPEVSSDTDDATLSALSLSSGTLDPVFASGTTSYTASVANAVSSITITPTQRNTNATLSYRDADDQVLDDADTNTGGRQVDLSVGANTIKVRVTAEDTTTTQTYTIVVTRNSAPVITTQSPVSVEENTTEVVTLAATDADGDTVSWLTNGGADESRFEVTTGGVLTFAAAPDFESPADSDSDNDYVVVLRASDGTDSSDLTLTVTVTDEDETPRTDDAALRSISLSEGTLDPVFASGIISYTVSVANAVSSITITPTQRNTNATLSYRDADDQVLDDADSNTGGQQVDLSVGANTIKVRVTAEDTTTTQTYTIVATRRDATGVCARTEHVRDAIVKALASIDSCGEVTAADLAKITYLPVVSASLTSVASGDFAGLTALRHLSLRDNNLTALSSDILSGLTSLEILSLERNEISSLPSGIFSGLTSLKTLRFDSNPLTSLPADIFSGLTSLEVINFFFNDLRSLRSDAFSGLTSLKELRLDGNDLSSLPSDIFSGLANLESLFLGVNDLSTLPTGIFSDTTSLKELYLGANDFGSLSRDLFSHLTFLELFDLGHNEISSLPSDFFSTLTSLKTIELNGNGLTNLPADIFSGLTSLENLQLDSNSLTSLPSGLFSGLSSLEVLSLSFNRFRNLPAGIFSGLSSLTNLDLRRGDGTNFEITVSLEKIGSSQFKAVIPVGAPFAMDLPVSASSDGEIDGDVSTLAVSTGAVDSDAVEVTRKDGTEGAVSVNIGELPVLPRYHVGYVLQTDDSVPLTVLSELDPDATLSALSLSSGALDPVFASGTTRYTAIVGNAVSTITITPTKSNTNATLVYRDANDQALEDADPNTEGHQVDLSVGENTISVRMTAEDTTTTNTYTIGVTRNTVTGICSRTKQVSDALVAAVQEAKSCDELTEEHLSKITGLDVSGEDIKSLKSGDFDGLSALVLLKMSGNGMTELPADIFLGLSVLETLELQGNQIRNLPPEVFSDLANVKVVMLNDNRLSSLPSGLLSGLNSLQELKLANNAVQPLPLTVSLEKVGSSAFKAVVPVGAPFAMDLPVSVSSDGEIDGDVSTLAVSTGAVGSDAVGVTRKEGTHSKITADIGVLPVLPDGHDGYVLQKDDFVPLTVLSELGTDATLSGLSLSSGTLDPVFASGTTSYDASVGNAVNRVTVTPATTNSAATLSYRDADGQVLDDADTNTSGQQVDLSVGENTIKVRVTAEDTTTTQTYTIVVTRNSAPVITTQSPISVEENTTAVVTLAASDADGDAINWSKNGGADASRFEVTTGGVLTFAAAPDFESLADADSNNDYVVVLRASDGTDASDLTLTVTVADVDEAPPSSDDATLSALALSSGTLVPEFDSATTRYAALVENITSSITVTPTKSDSNATLVYLDANDQTLDDADANTGGQQVNLSVGATTIKVKVTAEDTTTTQTYTLVVNRNSLPVFTTTSPISVAENSTFVADLEATDAENHELTWYIVGGFDSSRFTVTSEGELTFNSAPDFENPADSNENNDYVVTVGVRDAIDVNGLDLIINVTDVDEAPPSSDDATLSGLWLSSGTLDPVFASGTTSYDASVANSVSSITVTPTRNNSNATLSYLDVNDQVLDDADANTGGQQVDLSVGDNTIKVRVTAEDTTTMQTYTIAVTRNSAPAITTTSPVSVEENTTAVVTLAASDADGDAINWSKNGGADASRFEVTTGGLLTFTAAPDFESLADADSNNDYVVVVRASDGTDASDLTLTVTVTNVDEAPPSSDDATLSGLSLSSGTLDPVFASGTTSYDANSVSSITVTPTRTTVTPRCRIWMSMTRFWTMRTSAVSRWT